MNKKSGHIFILLMLGTILTLLFAGCRKKQEKVYDVAAEDLAYELSQRIRFDDVIAEVDPQNVLNRYELEDAGIKDVSGYMSSAATAEEIAVFVCEDGDGAASVKEKCEQRLKNQSDIYAAYAPEEVERLKSSYLEVRGNLVVLCVSKDPKAVEDTIRQFFGE